MREIDNVLAALRDPSFGNAGVVQVPGTTLGVRATLDHPLLELNKLLLDEMKQLADLGIYVGTYCQPMIPSLYQPVADPFETVQTIKAIGADRCIIGSDFGQVLHMDSIDGMRVFIRALLAFGISEKEIAVMLQENPARLLYLDDRTPRVEHTWHTRGKGPMGQVNRPVFE